MPSITSSDLVFGWEHLARQLFFFTVSQFTFESHVNKICNTCLSWYIQPHEYRKTTCLSLSIQPCEYRKTACLSLYIQPREYRKTTCLSSLYNLMSIEKLHALACLSNLVSIEKLHALARISNLMSIEKTKNSGECVHKLTIWVLSTNLDVPQS